MFKFNIKYVRTHASSINLIINLQKKKKNYARDTKHNLLNWKLRLASRYGRDTYLDGHEILQM